MVTSPDFFAQLLNGTLGDDRKMHVKIVPATPEWKCPMKCPFCYWPVVGEKEYRQPGQLEGHEIADYIASLQPSSVINAGRIQSKQAVELTRQLAKHGIPTGLVDRGSCMDAYTPEELRSFKNISISIDGGPEENDTSCGIPGAYDTATKAVIKLKELGCDPFVASVITRNTEKDFSVLEDFCWAQNVRQAVGLPIAVHAAEKRGFKITGDEYVRCIRRLIEGRSAKQIIVFSHGHSEMSRLGPIFRDFTWKPTKDRTALRGKSSGTSTIIDFRPFSVALLTEVAVRWTGKAHLSERVDPSERSMNLEAPEPYPGFWEQIKREVEVDRRLLDELNLNITL